MPSCCLVCSAVRLALSLATSASTRLPMPWVRLSCRLEMKLRWVARAFEPVPSLATEALTWLIEVLTSDRKVAAVVAVVNDAVAVKVIPVVLAEPLMPRARPWTVSLLEPDAFASA